MTDPTLPTPAQEPQVQGINLLTPFVASNPVLMFITTYWKAILLALLLLFAGYEWLRIDSLKNQVIIAEAATKAATDELETCRTKVTDLSQKVSDAAATSQKLQNQLDGLKPILDKISKNTSATAKKIMDQPAPKTCEEVQSYIIENQIDFGWKPNK